MEILHELTKIITPYKLRQMHVFGNPDQAETKLSKFYDGMINNKFQTDDDVAKALFDSNSENQQFKNIKSTFKNRLLNTIFFMDLSMSGFDEYSKIFIKCHKDWAASKILLNKKAYQTAIEICLKTLKLADKVDLVFLCMDITKTMRWYYAIHEPNTKKFRKYNELYKKYKKIIKSEILVKAYYYELNAIYSKTKGDKSHLYETAKNYWQKVEPLLRKHNKQYIHVFCRIIQLMTYSCINDNQKIIIACEEALSFFKQKKLAARTSKIIFLHQKLLAHIHLKEYTNGLNTAKEVAIYQEEGTHNWNKYNQLLLYLNTHTKNYQNAYEITLRIINHDRFMYTSKYIQEEWKISNAYISFLIQIGKIIPKPEDNKLTKFRTAKFLNEVAIFSQDKKGFNIAILIIHMLFLIINKKYDDAINRIEAIEKYSFRYLKKDKNFRSNYFIKMLLQIPISGFQKKETLERAEKYYAQLKTMPLDIADQSHSIEIIPYEDLWELLLEYLGKEAR